MDVKKNINSKLEIKKNQEKKMQKRKTSDQKPYINHQSEYIFSPVNTTINKSINSMPNNKYIDSNLLFGSLPSSPSSFINKKHSIPYLSSIVSHHKLKSLISPNNTLEYQLKMPGINSHKKNLSHTQNNCNMYTVSSGKDSVKTSNTDNSKEYIGSDSKKSRSTYSQILEKHLIFKKNETINPVENLKWFIKTNKKFSDDLKNTSSYKSSINTQDISENGYSNKKIPKYLAERQIKIQEFPHYEDISTPNNVFHKKDSIDNNNRSLGIESKDHEFLDERFNKKKSRPANCTNESSDIKLDIFPEESVSHALKNKHFFRINSSLGKELRAIKMKSKFDPECQRIQEAVRLSLAKLHTISLNQRHTAVIKFSQSRSPSQTLMKELMDEAKFMEKSQQGNSKLKPQDELDLLEINNKSNLYTYNSAIKSAINSSVYSNIFQGTSFNMKNKLNNLKPNASDKDEIYEPSSVEFFGTPKACNNTDKNQKCITISTDAILSPSYNTDDQYNFDKDILNKSPPKEISFKMRLTLADQNTDSSNKKDKLSPSIPSSYGSSSIGLNSSDDENDPATRNQPKNNIISLNPYDEMENKKLTKIRISVMDNDLNKKIRKRGSSGYFKPVKMSKIVFMNKKSELNLLNNTNQALE